ncbi:glycine--tRNA ligase subunit beta [Acidocella sp.]|uniref:glycine--tRNA ligase subunit beta n=1 Tax=Acidocella sp. TaxID=50710 RepID=UPI00261DA908|nr:glycine--tRNA ligase subunit beta [Acidocella sp.]
MAEFFLELFSEEIPARMQAEGASQLEKIVLGALAPLAPAPASGPLFGPRRIAVAMEVAAEVPESVLSERGPRLTAPDQAVAGFLRKHGAAREALEQEGGFWVLNRRRPAQPAAAFIAAVLPDALARLPWPKSMRWGSSGDFTWVRPLRRVVSLLDGAVIPFRLGPVSAGDETEGHRIHGPGPFAVSSAAVWEERLREHHVIARPDERRRLIAEGVAAAAKTLGLTLAPDADLLEEVTGLVEWPVPLIGQIAPEFMELPPEVRELSMKINQKYFALRDENGAPAPYFAFVANLAAEDGGRAIIAGNERVLRARLADARHFWQQDLKTPLITLLPKLERITFHARIGTQYQRAVRISELAQSLAARLEPGNAEAPNLARLAGLLAKADLVTQMVGEFPELQGIMGSYYVQAQNPGQPQGAGIVAQAIRSHYQPRGPQEEVPRGTVAVAVALADKLDTLREFFRIGETPTGAGDPFALRRCALGVIRIILENGLRLNLRPLLGEQPELFAFLIERLRVKLRGEGKRFDILDAVLAAGQDDDLVRLMKRVAALETLLASADGRDLLAAYKRAANILRIETAKDGPHEGPPDPALFREEEERRLHAALAEEAVAGDLAREDYEAAMIRLAALRPHIDAFFGKVTVNAAEPELRRNRLRLLARFTAAVNQVADFSRIEG